MSLKFPNKLLLTILAWIIAATIAISIRLYPLTSLHGNDSEEKAAVYVVAQLKQQITKQVKAATPTLSADQQDILIKQKLDEMIHQDSQKIRSTIDSIAQNLEASSATQKTPFLLASDSYYYYKLTLNIIEKGSISDEIKGSKYLHKQMLAPLGHWEPFNLHPYVGYNIYKFLKIFNSDIDVIFAISLTPLIIIGLSLAVFLWVGNLMGLPLVVNFVGSIFFLLAPILVRRSMFGWYDNDPYSALFPLLVIGLTIKSIQTLNLHKNIKSILPSSLLLCFTLASYALFWHGWMLLFCIICFAVVIILIFNNLVLRENSLFKPTISFLGIFMVGCFFGITLCFGPGEFINLFREGIKALTDFLKPQLSVWPDFYMSVSELKGASLMRIINLVGGKVFFYIAVGGILISSIYHLRKRDISQIHTNILLSSYLVVSILLTFGAERFALICLIPISICFTLGLNVIYQGIIKLIPKKNLLMLIPSLILLASIALPISTTKASLRTLINPIYNQTWEDSLLYIKNNTPKNSIINTWWPPGHFIKAIADRRVTFDGATINYPQGYWMAYALLNTNEREALGILRMLNNSGNKATSFLEDNGIKTSLATSMVKDVTRRNKMQASKLAEKVFQSGSQREFFLALTHQPSDPSYILLYNEFVNAATQLKFYGKWNFQQIEQINSDPVKMATLPKQGSESYTKFLWSLIGGPYRYSPHLAQVSEKNNHWIFAENIQINKTTKHTSIRSDQYGKGIPRKIYFIDKDGQLKVKTLAGATLNFSILLYKEGGKYSVRLCDDELARSLLVRLFFFDGKGLTYIKPFHQTSNLTARTQIKVFEVDWEKFEKDELVP